jgi:molecular chaperone HtpG
VEREENNEKKVVAETLNSRKALWLRSKAEITADEYHEFYKQLAHDAENPAKTIHYAAEGTIEFKALLYLPAHKPFDLLWGDSKKGLHLYIQRVFIMDDCEALLPKYLRFVRGVVDSPDLPLNVSREMLQQSAPLEKIKSNLTNKILSTLADMKSKEYDAYVKLYDELGVFLKEGVTQDWSSREKLADLLLFESTKTKPSEFTALGNYIERMSGEQKEIYYLTGDSRELMEQSPYLESLKTKGWEVLLLADPVDEFVVQALGEYKGKHLKAIDKAGVDQAPVDEDKKQAFQKLLDFFKEKLPDIKEARLSNRLRESAVCLVADEGDMSASMERFLHRVAKDKPIQAAKRILEINADHPVIQAVQRLHTQNASDARLEDYCRLLYDEAVIAEGSKVKDPLALAQRINELLVKTASMS